LSAISNSSADSDSTTGTVGTVTTNALAKVTNEKNDSDFNIEYSEDFISRLKTTQLSNESDLINALQERSKKFNITENNFTLPSPYYPRTSVWSRREADLLAEKTHRNYPVLSYDHHEHDSGAYYFGNDETVAWWYDLASQQEVCALKFNDNSEINYHVRTFSSREEALKNHYQITHYGRCGACSSLQDLSIYMSKGLTQPTRKCSKLLLPSLIKSCLKDDIGFTDICAEAWTYNAQHTRKECKKVCIQEYGLANLVLNRLDGKDYSYSGRLSECIKCDENISGMGFKALAGRTRRNSGLKSEIERDPNEILPLVHHYFSKD
jgi:hypothetical protein